MTGPFRGVPRPRGGESGRPIGSRASQRGRSRGRKVSVKQFIMNAHVVVGVGNIYASEALYLAGIITLNQAFSGFGNSTVIMIAALFVVGDGLSRTGVTAWLGDRMLGLAGSKTVRLLVVAMVGTAVLSAFISNTGTVATLMPAVTSAAWRIGSVPSRFLMPLAFAAFEST